LSLKDKSPILPFLFLIEGDKMVRISKQEERRGRSRRKRHVSMAPKTGAKKDNLENGYKEHLNTLTKKNVFIPKVK
jgi:hypothetical protein